MSVLNMPPFIMRMNSFIGKQILALVRNESFAHPGEETAIDLCLKEHQKRPARTILDIGCGLGGTAHYIQSHQWGQVTGIDIDHDAISHATLTYPEARFHHCDVVQLENQFSEKFDLLCLFTSFYSFDDKLTALKSMRTVAHQHAKLMIFDYVDWGNYTEEPRYIHDKPVIPRAFKANKIKEQLQEAGWQLNSLENLDQQFSSWYQELVTNIEAKKEDIIEISSENHYGYVSQFYRTLREAISSTDLGGCILNAAAI